MALKRSEVRRLHLSDLAQVHHQQPEQEWVPHWHEEWSFGAVLEGQCCCSVAGRPFVARAGDLIVIRPGVVHVGALTDPAHTGAVHLVMLYVPPPYLAQWGLAGPERSGAIRALGLLVQPRGWPAQTMCEPGWTAQCPFLPMRYRWTEALLIPSPPRRYACSSRGCGLPSWGANRRSLGWRGTALSAGSVCIGCSGNGWAWHPGSTCVPSVCSAQSNWS